MIYTLAIDFDGVIHDHKNIPKGRRMGTPIPGAVLAMKELKHRHHRLIIFSVRGNDPQHIADWLKYFDIPYDEITRIKPEADFYIDDKAIKFENNWDKIIDML